MSNVPEGATLSEDGYYWWDGTEWQAVEDGATAAATASGGTGEVTYDELAAITSADQLDEKYQAYFQPDYDSVPDDDSLAEASPDL